MKAKINIDCVGCQTKTPVLIRKPSVFVPSHVVFECLGCKSTIEAVVKKVPNGKKGDVVYNTRILTFSPDLMEFLINEDVVDGVVEAKAADAEATAIPSGQ
jgi:hypothetical protein